MIYRPMNSKSEMHRVAPSMAWTSIPLQRSVAMLRLWLSLAVEAERPHLALNLDFQN